MRVAFLTAMAMFFGIWSEIGWAESNVDVVAKSNLKFQPLNPLRGDASPKAGVLWGDIKKDVPTGTLIEFVDGFSSPPHIHNITYRAVVISGKVHNDDPGAEVSWMGPGSFWTQPAGENHITAAKPGNKATAFLEILEGPYLVRPAKEEFDNGERAINLDARNIVWLDASAVSWTKLPVPNKTEKDVQIAFLWGNPVSGQRNGTFSKLPSGFSGILVGNDSWLRAVVIKGAVNHQSTGNSTDAVRLDPGSYFGSKTSHPHAVNCVSDTSCVLYISTHGKYHFVNE